MTLGLIRPSATLPTANLAGFDVQFTPRDLFRSGAQGWWYDPSDFSALFQDSAGLTPVTAVGQPVGKQLDKSGNGNHRVQATAASRPTLRQTAAGLYYLEYDGVDDSMATASTVDFSTTDEVTLFCGVTKLSDAATAIVTELSDAAGSNNGSFWLTAPFSDDYRFLSFGTSSGTSASGTLNAPNTSVVTCIGDISGDRSQIRVNGSVAGTNADDQGTGNFGNYTAYFGRRANTSLPANFREYSNICVGKLASDAEIARTERWQNVRTGAW